ncbi:hypothetical protein EK21DRAFT_51809 [Setomelanomma holmii]|uniref:Uncharacterized protein n=1 Tax=Setomelanomma holmii TaxID=210430 RepID=A0A9P4HL44_9PLEO|nr:hypothetical protein EK21DRAFT_51809 [Setomelanomma holmii]
MRRSISRKKNAAKEPDSRPSTSSGLLSIPTTSSSRRSSNASRSSSKSGTRTTFRGVVNRLRSSSSASSLGAQSEADVNDIHDWFQGFRRYNQMAVKTSLDGSYDAQDFAKAAKPLTKNCGGQLIHALPEAAFDFALLWCPGGDLSARETDAPSWSWIAYNGPVNFPFDPTTCPDVYTVPKSEGELFRSEVVQYHVGSSDAQYTVRRETNGSLRTKYPPYFHAPRGSDLGTGSYTLRFTTSAISAEGFLTEQLHYQDKEIPCCHLFNDKDQHCGVVMDFHAAITQPVHVPGSYEFVLLSRNVRREPTTHRRPANPLTHPPETPIWDGERFVWDQQVVDFDDAIYEDGPWKMLNVILIQWVGEHAERVALARIHEDAWLAQNPKRKEIVLR